MNVARQLLTCDEMFEDLLYTSLVMPISCIEGKSKGTGVCFEALGFMPLIIAQEGGLEFYK